MHGIRRLGPLGERDFRVFWCGRTASELGSALVPVALVFAIIRVGGSGCAVGLVLSSGFVSRIVLLLVGGAIADRLPRQRVMLAADALRALTQALVAILLLTGEARVWHFIVLFLAYGAGDAFFSPASTGIVPELTGAGRLQQANALLAMSGSAAAVLGPAFSGLCVATAGPGPVFAIDAATFIASGLSLALLRLPARGSRPERSSILADIHDGWREVRSRTWVWASIVYFAVSNLAIAPLFVLGPLAANGSLGGPAAWGLIATCGGIGALLGDAASLRVRPRRPLTAGYLALAVWALEPALLAHPFSLQMIALAAVLGLGALSFSNSLWFTALQERIPGNSLSRVSSYDWLGSRALQPAGYALAGVAGSAIGIPATLLAGAALHATASIAIALSPPVRRVRRASGPARPLADG